MSDQDLFIFIKFYALIICLPILVCYFQHIFCFIYIFTIKMSQSSVKIDLSGKYKRSLEKLVNKFMLRIDQTVENQIIVNLNLSYNKLSSETMLEFLMNLISGDLQQPNEKKIVIDTLTLEVQNKLTTLKFLTVQTAPFFQTIVHLDLSSNELTSLRGLQQINTGSLRKLNLMDNQLAKEELKSVFSKGDFGELRELYLNRNQLQCAAFIEANHNMCKLRGLFIGGNRILQVEFTQSAFIHQLQHLQIESKLLQSLPTNLAILTSLKILNLSYNLITSAQGLRFIDQNNCLEVINLNGNYITSGKFLAQINLPNLKQLHMDSNRIVELNSYSIRRAKLTSLHLFQIQYNLLSGQFFKQLVVGLKQNQFTYANFKNPKRVSLGRFAFHQWIKKNILWYKSPF